jgi:hypothetical protein
MRRDRRAVRPCRQHAADRAGYPAAAPEPGPAWLAVDAPTSIQAELTIGFAASSDPVADGAARAVLLAMLDDGLRDLRDGMGASYGVDVAYVDAGAGPTLVIRGAVGEAQAGAALARVLTTIAALRDGADAPRAAFVRGRQRALDHAAVPPRRDRRRRPPRRAGPARPRPRPRRRAADAARGHHAG